MNKPGWADAPEWAEWLAMDRDGSWYWYSSQPMAECLGWGDGGLIRLAAERINHYKTLEQRP